MASWRKGIWTILAAAVAALVALGFYVATMAPGLSLAHGGTDGAELAVAVHTMGIPHPTGYPTYMLLGQVFRALAGGDLAGRLNLLSAVAAALTVGCIALAAGELFPGEEHRLAAVGAALTAGFSLAGAGLFWSQAVIAEVYTLHTFFLALSFWLLLRWRRRGGLGLPLAGLSFGLGLGNHLSLAFLLPALALFLLLPFRHLPHRNPHPPGPAFFLLPPERRPRWTALAATAGLALLGLSVYLYLPLRAGADPWLNWGDPRDWGSFWAHVSGQAYRHYLFQVPWPQVLANLSAAARLLLDDFAPRGLVLGLAGLFLWARQDRPALVLTALPAGLGLLLALTYGGASSQVHLLSLYLAWSLWAGITAGMVALYLRGRFGFRIALIALLLPLLGIPTLLRGRTVWTLRSDAGPLPVLNQALAALPPDSLLLTQVDERTFPLWYAQTVEGARPDVAVVDVRLLEWPWYRRQLPARYPGLVVPAEAADGRWLPALLAANRNRPAFVLEPLALPAGYGLRDEGPVQRVVPP